MKSALRLSLVPLAVFALLLLALGALSPQSWAVDLIRPMPQTKKLNEKLLLTTLNAVAVVNPQQNDALICETLKSVRALSEKLVQLVYTENTASIVHDPAIRVMWLVREADGYCGRAVLFDSSKFSELDYEKSMELREKAAWAYRDIVQPGDRQKLSRKMIEALRGMSEVRFGIEAIESGSYPPPPRIDD